MQIIKCIFFCIAVGFLHSCYRAADEGYTGTSTDDLADVRMYKPDSLYANVAPDCIRADRPSRYCSFATLPLLGMETENPTVEQIMNRVVVSHDWMGERIETLLKSYPPELLYIFRGVTAIVIDSDIRPAYYTASTGAIYLDPGYLWLSTQEKETVSTKEDFRSGYSDPLAFRALARYVLGNIAAYDSGGEERELVNIEFLVARLLIHELGHANDFFPYDKYDTIDRNSTPLDASNAISGEFISTRLSEWAPLTSERLNGLAGVMYRGETPSGENLEITAQQVGEAFADDGAADEYGYTTQYEDLAMLFEVALMKYFWEFDYDIAFIDAPPEFPTCDDILVRWGQRNRLGDDNVKARAQFVTNYLMPHIDMTLFYQNLEAAKDFVTDSSWCLPTPTVDEESFDGLQQKSSLPQPVPASDWLKPYL